MSPFAIIPESDWLACNALAFAIPDGFPVSPGHSLVVTRREVATWFEATPKERAAVMELVDSVRQLLEQTLSPKPEGWNVGFNAGPAAGQTVPHLHVHVIPRWSGDVADPRGGVRHAVMGKGNYLSPTPTEQTAMPDDADLCIGHPEDPFIQRLLPELPGAHEVDILAAFVQPSGVELVESALLAALQGGATVRILAGDYLGISSPVALRRLFALGELRDATWPESASCAIAVAELAHLDGKPSSFHAKAWRIRRDDRIVVWVGSSNLSHAALVGGVEWNLRATSSTSPDACASVTAAFDRLWSQATPLTLPWIEAYALRAKQPQPEIVTAEPEPSPTPLLPRLWQSAALKRLTQLRAEGFRRALAAVATGMGKTVLAALDATQVQSVTDTTFRVLVIAHRAEILSQTAATLRKALGHGTDAESWCLGSRSDLGGAVVLASVQKLARADVLAQLATQHFAYVIVDEVHHAEAPTWRRVLERLDAGFVLGLTATPERADGKDVAAIFDDVLACEVGISTGINEGALVPFAYHGLADDTDYTQIPWRNGRFSETELEQALMVSPRMDRLWRAWMDHPGTRTLLFCCSRRHARFACDWLRSKGVASAAVFSGEGSDDRASAQRDLVLGRIQALCTVDLFNEGVDIPLVDRVVMLRPTESGVVFVQQLGRGLRTAPDKVRLTVIDFVGNHRVFGRRLRHLLALGGFDGSVGDLRKLLQGETTELPPGCTLDVELAAIDLLRQFMPNGGGAVLHAYCELREEIGRRPQPLELLHRAVLPQTLRATYDHWFDFANDQGDLDDIEREVLAEHGDWLRWVETTNLTKSWKMVALRTLIDAGELLTGGDLLHHADKARAYLFAHPALREDLEPSSDIKDHHSEPIKRWAKWWAKWPINHLDPWIRTDGDRIFNRLVVRPELVECLLSMTGEIIDWRLADYVARRLRSEPIGDFSAKVSHSNGRPMLFVPPVVEISGRPVGPTRIRLPDGETWIFRFVKIACNVASRVGQTENGLPNLLRSWFGKQAGLPGTDHHLCFSHVDGVWSVAPVVAAIPSEPVSKTVGRPWGFAESIPPDADAINWTPVIELVAAATRFSASQTPEPVGWVPIPGRTPATGSFVAQVLGQSMEPTIPDRAWCLFRPVPAGSRNGRILLVQHRSISDPDLGGSYTVKRYRSSKTMAGDTWHHTGITLVPDNPTFSPIEIDRVQAEDLLVVAEFVQVVQPEDGG